MIDVFRSQLNWLCKLISRMGDGCITCKRPVTSRQQGIQCDVCLQWNHRTCNTGKLPFILHFHSVCKILFDLEVMSGILQQESFRTATWIDWVCTACQFFVRWPRALEYLWLSRQPKFLSRQSSTLVRPKAIRSSRRFITPPPSHSRKLLFLNVILIGARF